MLVCHCTGVSDRKIRKVIRSGAATTSEVGRACGAGNCCGGCVERIDELINNERAAHEAVSAPTTPSVDRPRL
ncbi:MAG: (2Fe-2S)-binding protein [Deltaproteobacteria bacterium]|nr:(2Fe-2S)-binding protein [Deltaproteobacteria bacterium]MBW2418181.1 (2Fe-2S)-binding protein [Deltaproteobacteria bacterium]